MVSVAKFMAAIRDTGNENRWLFTVKTDNKISY